MQNKAWFLHAGLVKSWQDIFLPRIFAREFFLYTHTPVCIYIYILNIQPFRVEYRYCIASKVGIFLEAEGQGKYSLPRVQYMPAFHKKGFRIFSWLHRIFSTEGTTASVATYPLTMRSIRGGILGWNIDIYSTPIWLVRFTRLCNKYIYIYTDTNPITLPCSLVRAGNEGRKERRNEGRNEEMKKRMNEWGMNKWMNEEKNEWMNEGRKEGINEWMKKRMNEWRKEGMNNWMNVNEHNK